MTKVVVILPLVKVLREMYATPGSVETKSPRPMLISAPDEIANVNAWAQAAVTPTEAT